MLDVPSVAPRVGSSTIVTGLGVHDRSCASSVSQSISKSLTGGLDDWAPVCVCSTHGSPCGVSPAGTAQGMG